MSKSIEGSIECPFYLEEGESFIKCEGILDNTISIHNFNDDKSKRKYEACICSVSGGKKCSHYRAVHLLYDRGLRC